MRHRREGYKLGRDKEQREALYRGLMISLIEHRKIKTTITKCKAIQPYIESLITLGRIDNPHNRRMALSRLASKDAMRALFAFAPEQFKDRGSGYTRITKLGPRIGDGAEMAIIELL